MPAFLTQILKETDDKVLLHVSTDLYKNSLSLIKHLLRAEHFLHLILAKRPEWNRDVFLLRLQQP